MNTLSHVVLTYIVLRALGILGRGDALLVSVAINLLMDAPAALHLVTGDAFFAKLKRFTHSFFMLLALSLIPYFFSHTVSLAAAATWLLHIVLDILFSYDVEYNIVLDYPLSRLVVSRRVFESSPRLEIAVTLVAVAAYMVFHRRLYT